MADATPAWLFNPALWGPGRAVFHIGGNTGTETIGGHTHWVHRTLCGRVIWRSAALDIAEPIPFSLDSQSPATNLRRDQAVLMGRPCTQCEAAGG